MTVYKRFHIESSLNLENANQFSSVAAWAAGMRDFSKELTFKIPKNWEKSYSLKEYDKKTILPIEELLSSRRSCRSFSSISVSLIDFSFILNHSLGVSYMDKTGTYFTYPNSGGIQSIIPIILVTNVEGIEQGVYYYDAKQFVLYRISGFDNRDYDKITSSDTIANQSSFSIHLFVETNQKCYKYQDRGYRFLLLECGHIMQSVHLCSTSIGLGCVMSGGGYDIPILESLNSLIKDTDMMVLYECFLGLV